LQPGDSAHDRLTRVQALAQMSPNSTEGALAVARAALDAREFAIARGALAPLAVAPTQRVAILMAELEELEHADEGRARAWMARAVRARRDPAWTADGVVSDRWMPVSPVTARLDAFVWKTPLAELEPEGAVIETKERVLIPAPPARPLDVPAGETKRLVTAPEPEPPASLAARRRPAAGALEPTAQPFERVISAAACPGRSGARTDTGAGVGNDRRSAARGLEPAAAGCSSRATAIGAPQHECGKCHQADQESITQLPRPGRGSPQHSAHTRYNEECEHKHAGSRDPPHPLARSRANFAHDEFFAAAHLAVGFKEGRYPLHGKIVERVALRAGCAFPTRSVSPLPGDTRSA